MMHPTEGEIRAFLDNELSDDRAAAVREHLAACPRCRARRSGLLESESVVGAALRRMATEPDLDRARRELQDRLSSDRVGTSPGPGPRSRWSPLLRAAVVTLLFLGGVTAALPGSPLRSWILGLIEEDAPTASQTFEPPLPPQGAVDGDAPAAEDDADGVTLRVEPQDGAVRIELTRVSSGTRIRIVLANQDRAEVTAPGATDFRSASGLIGVTAPGGEVTVQLPRTVASAQILANGRVLLRKDDQALEFPTLTPATDGEGFVLTVPDGFERADG